MHGGAGRAIVACAVPLQVQVAVGDYSGTRMLSPISWTTHPVPYFESKIMS